MKRITKDSVNWQSKAPRKDCSTCKHREEIMVEGYDGRMYNNGVRCLLNGWKTKDSSICDKWTEKVAE